MDSFFRDLHDRTGILVFSVRSANPIHSTSARSLLEERTALTTDDLLCEDTCFSGSCADFAFSLLHEFCHSIEDFSVDYGGNSLWHEILVTLSVVQFLLERERFCGVLLLYTDIPCIFLIAEDIGDCRSSPDFLAITGGDPQRSDLCPPVQFFLFLSVLWTA